MIESTFIEFDAISDNSLRDYKACIETATTAKSSSSHVRQTMSSRLRGTNDACANKRVLSFIFYNDKQDRYFFVDYDKQRQKVIKSDEKLQTLPKDDQRYIRFYCRAISHVILGHECQHRP